MADSKAGQEIHTISLDYLVVTESKEVLRKQNDGVLKKRCRKELERTSSGQSWNKLSFPKNKRNIHESIQI